jgi:hypothetical protein
MVNVNPFFYLPTIDTGETPMELTNEVMLNEIVYCFENVERVAEAKAWIEANADDTAGFREAFPDASPVSTHPLGSGGIRDV